MCGMCRAQAWHTSARVQTWPTAGLWTRTSSAEPAHWTRVSWRVHCALPQLQVALGRRPASRPWALMCSAANRRMLAVSFERGGILHAAVLQVTDTVWSRWPVRRTVQVRPGTHDPGIRVKWDPVVVLVLAGVPAGL